MRPRYGSSVACPRASVRARRNRPADRGRPRELGRLPLAGWTTRKRLPSFSVAYDLVARRAPGGRRSRKVRGQVEQAQVQRRGSWLLRPFIPSTSTRAAGKNVPEYILGGGPVGEEDHGGRPGGLPPLALRRGEAGRRGEAPGLARRRRGGQVDRPDSQRLEGRPDIRRGPGRCPQGRPHADPTRPHLSAPPQGQPGAR
jgi:hypothetical protein